MKGGEKEGQKGGKEEGKKDEWSVQHKFDKTKSDSLYLVPKALFNFFMCLRVLLRKYRLSLLPDETSFIEQERGSRENDTNVEPLGWSVAPEESFL